MSKLDPEQTKVVTEYIQRLTDFSSGTKHNCPHCGQEVTSARLYSKWEPDMYSLYVDPCGCRLGLWSAAPKWIERITVIDPEEEALFNQMRRKLREWNEKVRRWNNER